MEWPTYGVPQEYFCYDRQRPYENVSEVQPDVCVSYITVTVRVNFNDTRALPLHVRVCVQSDLTEHTHRWGSDTACVRARVCVSVCVRARARVCVRVCVWV